MSFITQVFKLLVFPSLCTYQVAWRRAIHHIHRRTIILLFSPVGHRLDRPLVCEPLWSVKPAVFDADRLLKLLTNSVTIVAVAQTGMTCRVDMRYIILQI